MSESDLKNIARQLSEQSKEKGFTFEEFADAFFKVRDDSGARRNLQSSIIKHLTEYEDLTGQLPNRIIIKSSPDLNGRKRIVDVEIEFQKRFNT